jgi:methyltransferase-like protein
MTLYSRRMLRVWVDPPACTAMAGERPAASVLARWQASQGLPATNRRHEGVRLTDLERCLLAQLDGGHDRAALRQVLSAAVQRGDFEIRRNQEPVKDPDDATLTQIIDHTLRALGQQALIIS